MLGIGNHALKFAPSRHLRNGTGRSTEAESRTTRSSRAISKVVAEAKHRQARCEAPVPRSTRPRHDDVGDASRLMVPGAATECRLVSSCHMPTLERM